MDAAWTSLVQAFSTLKVGEKKNHFKTGGTDDQLSEMSQMDFNSTLPSAKTAQSFAYCSFFMIYLCFKHGIKVIGPLNQIYLQRSCFSHFFIEDHKHLAKTGMWHVYCVTVPIIKTVICGYKTCKILLIIE